MGINVNLSKLILRGTPFSVFKKSGALAGVCCAIIIPPYAINVRTFLFAPIILLESSSDSFFLRNIESGVDLLLMIWVFSLFYCACLGVIAGAIAFALWRFKQLCLGLFRKGKTRVDARPLNQLKEGQLTLFLSIGILLVLCGMIKCFDEVR